MYHSLSRYAIDEDTSNLQSVLICFGIKEKYNCFKGEIMN